MQFLLIELLLLRLHRGAGADKNLVFLYNQLELTKKFGSACSESKKWFGTNTWKNFNTKKTNGKVEFLHLDYQGLPFADEVMINLMKCLPTE